SEQPSPPATTVPPPTPPPTVALPVTTVQPPTAPPTPKPTEEQVLFDQKFTVIIKEAFGEYGRQAELLNTRILNAAKLNTNSLLDENRKVQGMVQVISQENKTNLSTIIEENKKNISTIVEENKKNSDTLVEEIRKLQALVQQTNEIQKGQASDSKIIANQSNFTVGIRDKDGKRITVAANVTLPLAFCQMIGKTLFKQLEVYVNGVLVESSPLYAWRSIIETELNFDQETKNSTLSLGGYAVDDLPDNSPKSKGHVARQTWAQKDAQYAATLNLNLFNQPRLLLNYVDFKLVAYLNDSKFVVKSLELDNDKNSYTYELLDIKLLLHEYELHDSVSMAIEQLLKQEKMITYPLTSVEMRSFYVTAGRFDAPECRLLTSALPKRVIMCMVDAESYLGVHTKVPFNFKHFDVKDVSLECNGRTIPARPMNLNFEEGLFIPAYQAMIEGSGMGRSTGNNGITRDMFKNGYTFFVFEISPNLDSETFDLIKIGTTSFNVKFNKAVPTGGLYCILHAEYDSVFSIDDNRVPHVDAQM
ncbi:hypothetical protein PENTCL1PPCAC_30129, partial [Pristionchus entomophagus]